MTYNYQTEIDALRYSAVALTEAMANPEVHGVRAAAYEIAAAFLNSMADTYAEKMRSQDAERAKLRGDR